MHRRMAFLLGMVSLLMAAAPAAWAVKVPFNVDVPINGQGPIEAGVPVEEDTGMVGICDPELGCTGFRATAYTTEVSGGTWDGAVTLKGYVCVGDTTEGCGTADDPFTGVRITDRVVDVPEAYVNPFLVHVNFCLWLMSPQDTPHGCNLPSVAPGHMGLPDSGNIIEKLGTPSSLGLNS